MSSKLSSPFSSGNGGPHFEAHVQASYVVLLLTGGYAPCLPCLPIKEIKLQGKVDGYDTDDVIIFTESIGGKYSTKLLVQAKHGIEFTGSNAVLPDVLSAAWNDFNNKHLFTKDRDKIAIVTGPLNKTDSWTIDWLLDQARQVKTYKDFYDRVKTANFSPSNSEEKLNVIRDFVQIANGDQEVTDESFHYFLKHLHLLGYDLGKEHGVVLSLLHSHLSQFNIQYPEDIWGRVVDIVQCKNQGAGTITRESLPRDLLDRFQKGEISRIPLEIFEAIQANTLLKKDTRPIYEPNFAKISLIGGWNEVKLGDLEQLGQFFGEPYSEWVVKARDILMQSKGQLTLKDRTWAVPGREDIWSEVAAHLFDQDLDDFKELAVSVLTEHDPAFELDAEERFAAGIHGKVMTHSSVIRKGVAEGLALLGCRSDSMVNCSKGKGEVTAVIAVRQIFQDADWRLWGSLNDLLPILAEAAPREFLDAIENALEATPNIFEQLFSEERNGVTGRNYLTGLLWGLESLAWESEFLGRVCLILSALASRDPGGNWANRPINSLMTILLPWFPQTKANNTTRRSAVSAVCRESPHVGWQLLISLLPNQRTVTTGSHKPSWRKSLLESQDVRVSTEEYLEEVEHYAEMAISMADSDPVLLGDLIEHILNLPRSTFDLLLQRLSSEKVTGLPEKQRFVIWNKLSRVISQHAKSPTDDPVFSDMVIEPIVIVTNKLAPRNPRNLYRNMFSDRYYDFYEEGFNYEENQSRLEIRRVEAIKEIISRGGVSALLSFAEEVELPNQLGYSFSSIANHSDDIAIIPSLMGSDSKALQRFVGGYIWGRHHKLGWGWSDTFDRVSWSRESIEQFLLLHPFVKDTWDRVEQWLGSEQAGYWSRVNPNPYHVSDDVGIAVDKLIEYKRPLAAVSCLYGLYKSFGTIDVVRCIQALLAALDSNEPANRVDSYEIADLIRALQDHADVIPDDLFRIEWAYLPVLNGYSGAVPKTLERRLATDPSFFCELIRLIFRPKHTHVPAEPSEKDRQIAANAWNLLNGWKIPPGTGADGLFSGEMFVHWLQEMKATATESGHLEVALTVLGEVLIHCPADPDGLWINRAVAESLDARWATDMRAGFRTGAYNSRGAHWVDPTAAPERGLADSYRKKAADVEQAGYPRFASSLREMATSYDQEADRIIEEHTDEGNDREGGDATIGE